MAETVQSEVDLTNCDREPIHVPGSIQPHGCMIVCDPEAVLIRRHSVNALAFLGLPEIELNGLRLEEILGGTPTHELRNALARSGTPSRAGLMPGLRLPSGKVFDVAVHRHNGNAILEFEVPSEPGPASPLEFARTLVGRLTRKAHVQQIVRDAAKLLRAVLQYDRVMIYRFDEDGSGKVVSEAKRADLESFSGQHFPASDIPQQARQLYLLNPIRIVSDASCERVAVTPAFDEAGALLDMSYAHLRSVSPIHCEYLRNMGVAASMSISVIIGGELWGLIACHHYSPRSLSMSQRVAAEIFGEFFSLQLEALIQKEKLAAADRARGFFETLLAGTAHAADSAAFLSTNLDGFRDLLPCDGIGLWLNGRWSAHGSTPPADAVPALARFIGAASEGRVWSSHELSRHLPEAASYCAAAAGVMAVPLSQIPRDYLLFFRKEVLQTIEWGGDPGKTYSSGLHGDRLTPRQSFAIWKQTVERQSHRWSPVEQQLAETARTALIEIVMKHGEVLAEERSKAELRQKWLNQELDHRVKNILALITSLVSHNAAGGQSVEDYVGTLKGRIEALAYAHDQLIRSSEGGRLAQLLAAELSPYRGDATAVTLDGPDAGFDARSFSVLALVFHELTTNAAKYGALSREGGRLSVTWSRTPEGDCEIVWREAGGPVVRPPTRQGFGTVLIERSLPFDLGGSSAVDYAEQGLQARFIVPARFVEWDVGPGSAAVRADPAPAAERAEATPLAGKRVLLVEDQFLIAMDVEDMLRLLGAADVTLSATVADAMRRLDAAMPDVAVLDVNLGHDTSAAIATRLAAASVPFVFATGYGEAPLDGSFGVPVVRKPYHRESLLAGLAQALGTAS